MYHLSICYLYLRFVLAVLFLMTTNKFTTKPSPAFLRNRTKLFSHYFKPILSWTSSINKALSDVNCTIVLRLACSLSNRVKSGGAPPLIGSGTGRAHFTTRANVWSPVSAIVANYCRLKFASGGSGLGWRLGMMRECRILPEWILLFG